MDIKIGDPILYNVGRDVGFAPGHIVDIHEDGKISVAGFNRFGQPYFSSNTVLCKAGEECEPGQAKRT